MINKAPDWLNKLEQKFGSLAIPHFAYVVVGIQLFGIIAMFLNEKAIYRLVLVPELVMQGEIWRVFTFMSVPMQNFGGTFGLIFLIIYIYILYFIANALESAWGGFKSTLYLLIAWALTVAYSFFFDIPIVNEVIHIMGSIFLAVAMLFPDEEILLFFVLPVKFRWLSFLVIGLVLYAFFKGSWLDKIYLLLVYGNYMLFFGPYHIDQVKQWQRRRKFKDQWK